jgi:hypothetical protein
MFDNEGKYIGFQDLEIRQQILDLLNEATNSNPVHTFDSIVNTPLGAIFIALYQLALQGEISKATLQTELVKFIMNKINTNVIAKGGSVWGLEKALLDLSFVDFVNIVDKNKENSLTGGFIYPLVIFKTDSDTEENKATLANELAKYRCNVTEYIPTSIAANQVNIDIASPFSGQTYNIKYVIGQKKAIKVKVFYRFNKNIDYSTQKLTSEQIKQIYKDRFNSIVAYGHEIYPSIINNISFFPSIGELKTQYAIDGVVYDTDYDLIKTPALNPVSDQYDIKDFLYIDSVDDISLQGL